MAQKTAYKGGSRIKGVHYHTIYIVGGMKFSVKNRVYGRTAYKGGAYKGGLTVVEIIKQYTPIKMKVSSRQSTIM